jgi:UDP-glucose 4-epimerase
MKILVTGNNGYIGTVLTSELHKKNYEVVGYDADYFDNCILINDNNYNSNTVNRPFNIYERSVSHNSVSFPITSNTVYPHILFYTYAQDILLTVNNYYLRRIA